MSARRLVVVMLIPPSMLLAATARRVEVLAQVPFVAEVERPGSVTLQPGETRRVTLRVACNQPWLLCVDCDNPQISSDGRHTGPAGGMTTTGNTFTVTLSCSPRADGPQSTTLATRLIGGPLVAQLPR